MGVVVEEMTSEVAPAAAPVAASAGSVPSGPAREVDMDRLDQAMRRQRHRAERLWAD